MNTNTNTKPTAEQCRWNSLDGGGLVRITWQPDDTEVDIEHFDAEIRDDVIKSIDTDGVWSRIGEYKCGRCGAWRHGNAVHGFIGQHDEYDDDIKRATMDARATEGNHDDETS